MRDRIKARNNKKTLHGTTHTLNFKHWFPTILSSFLPFIIVSNANAQDDFPEQEVYAAVLEQSASVTTDASFAINSDGRITFQSSNHGEISGAILDQALTTIINNPMYASYAIPGILADIYPDEGLVEIIDEADVLSMSYAPSARRTVDWARDFSEYGGNYSIGNDLTAQNPENLKKAKELWENNPTITLQSAGNSGSGKTTTGFIDLGDQAITSFNMNALKVGAVEFQEGVAYVSEYSSSTAPTLLSANPYHQGFSHPYFKPIEEMAAALDSHLSVQTSYTIPPIDECGENAQGVELIKQYQEQTISIEGMEQKARFDIQNALQNCYTNSYIGFVDQGNMTVSAQTGTSWTTPYAAGFIAGTMVQDRQMYGDKGLNRTDYTVAAMLAAQPVWQARKTIIEDYSLKQIGLDVNYIDNGASIAYNVNLAGYGYLGPDEYRKQVQAMAEQVKGNPSLKTEFKRVGVEAEIANYPQGGEKIAGRIHNIYPFRIKKDLTTVRLILEMEFDKTEGAHPLVVHIKSPTGTLLPVPLSHEVKGDKLTFGFSSAFLGTGTEGEWTLYVPETGHKVGRINLDLRGVERNGVIDWAIEQHGKSNSALQEITRKPQPRQQRLTFK